MKSKQTPKAELKNPLVLAVHLAAPAKPMPVAAMLARTGSNTGNMLFAQSAVDMFDDVRSIPFGVFKPEHAEGHDCIVVAAANWLNKNGDMGALADKLEAANLPIIALGLGAQAGFDGRIPPLRPGTQRLVSLLAERSPLISARGPFSCEVLAHYGAKNAHPTGCPSLLMSRGRVPEFLRPDSPSELRASDIALHSTRHRFNQADEFHTFLYRQAYAQGYDILLQSELADFFPALGRLDQPENLEQAHACLQKVYQAPVEDIEAFLQEHGKVFFSIKDWLEYCGSKRFFLGTRIHGTIAAILANTPALLIAHDSRTLELAETMSVPFVLEQDIDPARPLEIDVLYERATTHDFTVGYRRYWKGFQDFFDGCGLKTNLFQDTDEPLSGSGGNPN